MDFENSPSSTANDDSILYSWTKDELIAKRYKVLSQLGEGTFGRVLEVLDLKTKQLKALKIVMPVYDYIYAAEEEAKTLVRIRELDTQNESSVVKLLSKFMWEEKFWLVFEKLGKSLNEVIEMNEGKPFNEEQVADFARQMFDSLRFFASIGLTHADLKPENVLFETDEIIEHEGLSIPKTNKIKIIDMGLATWRGDKHMDIIWSQFYRPPEIILGLPWGHSADFWSMGCILAELVSGRILFQSYDNYEQLAMFEKALGSVPKSMVEECKGEARDWFYYVSQRFNWPALWSGKNSRLYVRRMKQLEHLISNRSLRDLIYRCLDFDPTRRINADSALRHPFLI